MTATSAIPTHTGDELEALEEIQQRVLWLAVRMVDVVNRDLPKGGVKVGGHQASTASVVTAMTALYFRFIERSDFVSVKPHASPALHAIQYLLGSLDRGYLTTLRGFGGLQSYPSRTKDPDRVDFSTGSVGLGAAAPLFAAAVRRYVDDHFGARPRIRFVALIGDAELDEGNVWEAIADCATHGLGNVMWIVDTNRQSLDRVVPGIRTGQLETMFSACGWQVLEVKYGSRLRTAFARAGGGELRSYLDAMSNEQYQSFFKYAGAELRDRFCAGASSAVRAALAGIPDDELAATIQDLGGHDLAAMLDAYHRADQCTDRPTVIFAYTVKGWGLPLAGDPLNHSALLKPAEIDALRTACGLTVETEWDTLDPASAAGQLAAERGRMLARSRPAARLEIQVPAKTEEQPPRRAMSTQDAFGRLLTSLGRDDALAPYLVTTSPDVSVSTNLGSWINKFGVYATGAGRDTKPTRADGIVRWQEHAAGRHIELGISEMNLFLLLGQLGLSWDLSGQPLLPIGTLYDPFVCRGLDAFLYGTYSDARFVVAGTPSGVTLAPEGGAHQSVITPSVGLELPGVTTYEPAYAGALDWILCDALRSIAAGQPGATYLRLSTRPIDNAPFQDAWRRDGEAALRKTVLAGGYQLVEPDISDGPLVHLAGSGAVLPEVLDAAAELADEGVRVGVVDVTSLDRLYRAWQDEWRHALRHARRPETPWPLGELFAPLGPIVTVHDAASHAMAWLGSALGVRCISLGVDEFGQSGGIDDLYELHDLSSAHIVNAALATLCGTTQ